VWTLNLPEMGVSPVYSFGRFDMYWMRCIEKNFCEDIIKTIWGLKDTLKVWLDMEEDKIISELHAIDGGARGVLLLPHAPYVLSKGEKALFVKIIHDLKIPSNYVGQYSKRVSVDGELRGLKSHDYHVLMQQILPLYQRTTLNEEVQTTIIRICRIFTRLCAKSIDPSTILELMEETTVTMCMLEKSLLPIIL
jgi:hypothetical protein